MKFAAVNYAADKSRIRSEIRRTWPVESQPCAGCYRGHAPARTRPSLLGAMRKCRAASNRSAVRVARDAGRPHPAIHMFAWLKSHFFCFLLLICAQGPAGRLGCNTAIARTISTSLSGDGGVPYGSPNNNNARTGALSNSIVRWSNETCTSVYSRLQRGSNL
jgi:hypothetical protein